MVVGEADDAEGLEDGLTEDGGEHVGLFPASPDGEVGVGEDEQDDVVDGGGADGEGVEDGGVEGVFGAGGSLGVGDAGAEGEAELAGEGLGDDGEVGAGVEDPGGGDVVGGEVGGDGAEGIGVGGEVDGGVDADRLGRGGEEELEGVGVVLIVFEEGGREAGGVFGEQAGVEGGGLGVAEELDVDVGERAEDQGEAGGGERSVRGERGQQAERVVEAAGAVGEDAGEEIALGAGRGGGEVEGKIVVAKLRGVRVEPGGLGRSRGGEYTEKEGESTEHVALSVLALGMTAG